MKTGAEDDSNKYLPTQDEKIQYINEDAEKREKEEKEKASIKYNF